MTIERAKQLAKKWANGYVCSLREGEAEEYHKLCFSALQEQQEQESNARMTVAKLRKFVSAKPPVCGYFACGGEIAGKEAEQGGSHEN